MRLANLGILLTSIVCTLAWQLPESRAADDIANPTVSTSPSPTVSPSPAAPEPNLFRIEYAHTLGNPNYHGNADRGLTFESGASSSLALQVRLTDRENPVFLGFGYQWVTDVDLDGMKLTQSFRSYFFQAGGEYTLFSVAGLEPRIGASFQFAPKFLSPNSEEDELPDLRFQWAVGYRVYTCLHFLKDYTASLGYEGWIGNYNDGSDDSGDSGVYLSHYSVYFSLGLGF